MTLPKVILIKYHDDYMPHVEKIDIGDWIDLRSAEDYELKAGDYKLINLGVSMRVPSGYEAHLKPRSSTFKNYGILQSNSVGIIDESYSSDKDIWMMPVYATRDTKINKYDRICQFRIMRKMGEVILKEIDSLGDNARGGFGSTGVK